jgi:hypothetical protein
MATMDGPLLIYYASDWTVFKINFSIMHIADQLILDNDFDSL